MNLSNANIIIHYESDWNGELDEQAEKCIYSIKQEKPVHIFRLITKQSVDEMILEYAERRMKTVKRKNEPTQVDKELNQSLWLSDPSIMNVIVAGSNQLVTLEKGTIIV